MFQRQGGPAMKKDLTNTRRLLEELGHPERRLRVIHVGGTNGKGSTAHLLAAALQSGGKQVGLYTSPHYKDFRERIKINHTLVSEAFVVDFIDSIREAAAEIRPSFFEMTVAMAFEYFAQEEVDWAVIEVGLGGRLDSTNVVDPVLSVITNISKDHVQFLGDTYPQIAYEKAGIIKPSRPVVIGKSHPETDPVFLEKARKENAPIVFADQLWKAEATGETAEHTSYETKLKERVVFDDLRVNLHGPFQAENIQTALSALHVLHGLKVGFVLNEEALRSTWKNLKGLTYYIGRWQVLERSPMVLVDSAHNPGGIEVVMERLNQLSAPHLHMVIGVVEDKDLSSILPLFPKRATYYFVKADIPRGLPASELAAIAAQYGLVGGVYSSVAAGYEVAKASAEPTDVVFVGGSIFTVAEVL